MGEGQSIGQGQTTTQGPMQIAPAKLEDAELRSVARVNRSTLLISHESVHLAHTCMRKTYFYFTFRYYLEAA